MLKAVFHQHYFGESRMRKVVSVLLLALAVSPAFASISVPEPESLSLFAIGGLGMLLAHRGKKK